MFDVQSWLNTGAQLTVAGGVGYGIFQRIMEARLGKARAAEQAAATLRTEEAARLAAAHAAEARAEVASVVSTITEIKEQTNGMSHRLETLAGEAGEGRGRAQEIAKQEVATAAATDAKKP